MLPALLALATITAPAPPTPAFLAAPCAAIDIRGGLYFSLALGADGSVRGWGRNHKGILGVPTPGLYSTPTLIPGLAGIRALSAGNYHALALRDDGVALSWGVADSGQLGRLGDPIAPAPVDAIAAEVIAIAAGGSHSLAVLADGSVLAWGENQNGQLGNGTQMSSPTPVPVIGLTSVVAVAAGARFSLALRSDGTVWSWGQNVTGALGNGTFTDSSVPAPATGLTGITAIAAGGAHGLARRSNGTVWSWGANYGGQLGNGTKINSNLPARVAGLTSVTKIAAGTGHSLVARADKTVWVWGWNIYHQLGDGTNTDAVTPLLVGSNANAVAGGTSHSLVISIDGTLWAWGNNLFGEVGNGSTATASVPVPARAPEADVVVPLSVPALTDGLVASVPDFPGASYSWSLQGGPITSGLGSPAIEFSTGSAGSLLQLDVEVSAAGFGCASANTVRMVQVEFTDVPPGDLFHDAITTFTRNGMSGGCGNGYFCPLNAVTRAQAAVFLLRARHGAGYTPPPATGTLFTDVGAGDFAAGWIEQLANEGITGGCAAGRFCPDQPVSRAEMAVFLLRARYGPSYVPAGGYLFFDVQPSHFAYAWIYQLAREGITGGCAVDAFCPNLSVTRGQMAVFVVRAFGLQ